MHAAALLDNIYISKNPNIITSSGIPRSPKQWNTKATVVGLTKIDEAFVDFWSDGLTDPIAADWPNFVLCRLKPLPDMPAQWLVIEQTFTRPLKDVPV